MHAFGPSPNACVKKIKNVEIPYSESCDSARAVCVCKDTKKKWVLQIFSCFIHLSENKSYLCAIKTISYGTDRKNQADGTAHGTGGESGDGTLGSVGQL